MIARIRRHRLAAALLRDLADPALSRQRHGTPRLLGTPPFPASPGPDLMPGEPRLLMSLARWLNAPLAEHQPRPLALPAWHCTMQAIAADVMDRTGLAPPGDPGGVRWIAARHGDHLHIIATLARQDTGALPPVSDHSGARRACYAAEDRLGLHSTRQGRPAVAGSPCPVGSRDTGSFP